jgi:L-lactate dehydrogenase complex protein LldE
MTIPPLKTRRPKAGLFVTCLVDLIRPSVGFAAARLIELAGCEVMVPKGQTCCGQPAYNSGDKANASSLARQTVEAFQGCDYVVVPSGSCAGQLKLHVPRLLAGTGDAQAAEAFAARVFELTDFLHRERKLAEIPGVYDGTATYHDSCSGLRELHIKDQPRALLAKVTGLKLKEMAECETCCGFGGLFSVKFPDISNAIVERKAGNAVGSQAELLLGGDLGCLMNMAGKLTRTGAKIECRHIAEVLAGEFTAPPIAKGR